MDRDGRGAVDLAALAREGDGRRVLWTLGTDDLNLNLLRIEPESSIDVHVNTEVDVLLVGVEGQGIVEIDGEPVALGPGRAIVIPKGLRRAIRCEQGYFAYLSCHRRRAGLWPRPPGA